MNRNDAAQTFDSYTEAEARDHLDQVQQQLRDTSPLSPTYQRAQAVQQKLLTRLSDIAAERPPTDAVATIQAAEAAALDAAPTDRARERLLRQRHARLTRALPDDDPARVFDAEAWLADPDAETQKLTAADTPPPADI